VFPHQASFLLDLPARRFLLDPMVLGRRLRLQGTERVLEIGAGSGFYSRSVAGRCARLVAVDVQPEMLVKMRPRVKRREMTAPTCIAANGTALPFVGSSFDIIFMVAVFGEVVDQTAFLSEIARVLVDGGTLAISEHLPDPDFVRSTRLVPLIEQHGFRFAGHRGPWWAYTATFRKPPRTTIGSSAPDSRNPAAR
jgi:ubiquinone/menaquinone biosynthesis C-methylase UbiE